MVEFINTTFGTNSPLLRFKGYFFKPVTICVTIDKKCLDKICQKNKGLAAPVNHEKN